MPIIAVMILIFFLAVGLTVLALPAAVKKNSLRYFFVALLISFFGIVLPLAFFLLSAALSPDSKAASRNGWIDCFYLGKLALTPFVLWASAAFYGVEIYKVTDRTRRWIVLGFFIGAVVSTICAIFGIATNGSEEGSWFLLLVPIYTAVWYSIRSVQLVRAAKLTASPLVMTVASSLPFWAAGIWWSYTDYISLPDQSGCFIVTAAARGHRKIVGPLLAVQHRGETRFVTAQLATFWRFESLWRSYAPISHGAFRRVYNRVGPIIARCILTPWLADAIYLALKPAELFARCLLAVSTPRRRVTRTFEFI